MPETEQAKVTLFLSSKLHALMKELAKRKRITLGHAYDLALTFFLKQPGNYMSMKRERQLRKAD